MANLVVALRFYVIQRLNTDPGWRHVKVLLSDASVPGEGEHKIMDYIRRQRILRGYDPNTRHVLYGLDADLIMLGLATHEPHFTILREDVFAQEKKKRDSMVCSNCGIPGHRDSECKSPKGTTLASRSNDGVEYIFLHVPILREYLEAELSFNERDTGFAFDLENALDDWVFLCFFVGNDFLPHLPCLEIREGAIDMLIDIYRSKLGVMGGYLTNLGHVHLDRAQHILQELGNCEESIFRLRQQREEERSRRNKINGWRREGKSQNEIEALLSTLASENNEREMVKQKELLIQSASAHSDMSNHGLVQLRQQTIDVAAMATPIHRKQPKPIRISNHEAGQILKEELFVGSGTGSKRSYTEVDPKFQSTNADGEPPKKRLEVISLTEDALISMEGAGGTQWNPNDLSLKQAPDGSELSMNLNPPAHQSFSDSLNERESLKENTIIDNSVENAPNAIDPLHALQVNGTDASMHDTVQLHRPGWRERYYSQKFGQSDPKFRKKVADAYMEGLCWVLHYYYLGCPSWKWFYPYHYAPFACDFEELPTLSLNFELGEPFRPVEQLMGVFPAASRKHIPPAFHELMTSEESSIIDFYPDQFEIDLNGKRHAWQGVALLPFIDESRLLSAIKVNEYKMTDRDKLLNSRGNEILLVSHFHPLFPTLCSVYAPECPIRKLDILLGQIAGEIGPDPRLCPPGATLQDPFPNNSEVRPVRSNKALSVLFTHPVAGNPRTLLPGIRMPPRVLAWGDISFAYSRHRQRNPHLLASRYNSNNFGSSGQRGYPSHQRQSAPQRLPPRPPRDEYDYYAQRSPSRRRNDGIDSRSGTTYQDNRFPRQQGIGLSNASDSSEVRGAGGSGPTISSHAAASQQAQLLALQMHMQMQQQRESAQNPSNLAWSRNLKHSNPHRR
jgi:5'-3' exoribonuclease 2